MTRDHARSGTTNLFAAPNVLEGTVTGGCFERHRHEEFLRFLRLVDRQTPPRIALRLIVGNHGTHKHPRVRKWLAAHRRFHLHPAPAGSSWQDLVGRWFAEITRERNRRGVFHSVQDLKTAIGQYAESNNRNPRPFVWTKQVGEILEKVRRCKAAPVTEH